MKNSDAIFAIGNLQNRMGIKTQMRGGTAWACQEGIDNNIPVYVFDQNTNKWYEWCKGQEPCDKFIWLKDIPELTETFAGIGTRDINENGINAIKELLKRKDNL